MSPAPTPAPRAGFVLAVDLGTGGPKVGLVSLTGSIAWSGPRRGRHPPAPRWGRRAGRRAVVAGDRRRHAAGHGERGRATRAGGGGVVHRAVGEHRPRGRRRPTRGRLRHVDGQPRRAVTRGAPWAVLCRATPRWRCGAGCAAPAARRRHRARTPSVTCSIWSTTSPSWPARRAGTWSPSTTCPCASPAWPPPRHASMTAAWLTDNRRPDRLQYDPVLVRARRRARRQAAAAGGHRVGGGRGGPAEVGRRAGPARRGGRRHRARPTCTPRRWDRVRCSTTRPTSPSARPRGSAARCP